MGCFETVPLRRLRGVGERTAGLFERLGIRTVEDLLWAFPRRYEDRRVLRTPGTLDPGAWNLVLARVERIESLSSQGTTRSRSRAILVGDHGEAVEAVWFHRRGLERQLRPGIRALFWGRVEVFGASMGLVNPDFDTLSPDACPEGSLFPVYPATAGLSQRRFRNLVRHLLDLLPHSLSDPLPETLRLRRGLVPLAHALEGMHFPRDVATWQQARCRLAFEELFLLQVALALARNRRQHGKDRALALPSAVPLLGRFRERLPFSLTNAQERVLGEIRSDLATSVPMHRLLQGDVGSGKTVVAAEALVIAAAAGAQSAFLVPTEVLARQHHARLEALLAPLGIVPCLLLGGMGARERRRVREALASGEAAVAVGTHALLGDGVDFQNLALVIVDEQHRFGVLQRAALAAKGLMPHVLVMTATPIPRTLVLGIYGDLAVSVLEERPPGRQPVETRWISRSRRGVALDLVRRELAQGHQGFWICPLVEEDEGPTAAVEERVQTLRQLLPGVSVGFLHGRLGSQEKARVLEDFSRGDTALLVSTSVVEVGIDVPRATVLVVEDAPRFGLAQLHQLRGRVGRGHHRSFCLFVGDPSTPEGRRRLEALCASEDGFALAEEDLRLRGPGEMGGVRQHGCSDFRVADLVRDGALLEAARLEARELVAQDAELKNFPELRKAVERRLGERFALLRTG